MEQQHVVTDEMKKDAERVYEQAKDILAYHPEASATEHSTKYQCNELTIVEYTQVNIEVCGVQVFLGDKLKGNLEVFTFRNGNWRVLLDNIHRATLTHQTRDMLDDGEAFAPFDLYETWETPSGTELVLGEDTELRQVQPTHPQTIRECDRFEAEQYLRQGWTLFNTHVLRYDGDYPGDEIRYVMVKQNA